MHDSARWKWLPVVAAATVIYGVMRQEEPEASDQRAFWHYAGLCVALAAFNWLPVLPVTP
jgi:hypothetical protein